MKAYLKSTRIAPKKLNLIAKLIRGSSVPDAIEALRLTHKKGARVLETLLRSAVANASHNDRQDPQSMVVKTVVINQGQAYHRGIPMARGRVRPIKKFLSSATITLGFADDEKPAHTQKKGSLNQKAANNASQEGENKVQKGRTSTAAKKTTGARTKKAAPASSESSSSAS